jgi:two-component system, OmpR family, sensor histidine kinase TctE
MPRHEPSLFLRLLVLVAALLAVGGAVLVAVAWFAARAAADEAYDRLLLGAAYQIADAVTVQEGKPEIELPVSAFELLALSEGDRIFYRVIDPSGTTMTGYDDLADPALSDAVGPLVADATYRDETVRMARIARRFDDPQMRGEAVVIVAQTVSARAALARDLSLRSFLLIAVMGLLAIGGTYFAVRRALAPIGRLERAIRQRDPLDLTLLDVSAPRELRPFVNEINRFIAGMRSRVELMQHFVADAAHQIRTPLAALEGQVELLANHADVASDPRLERIRIRTRELSRLANQLLSHAMVAHRGRTVQRVALNLTELVRRAVDQAVPDISERETIVTFRSPSSAVTLTGDPIAISEGVKNIVDNALRHGVASAVQVTVTEDRDSASVDVEDDGPGIPESEWPRVIKRFGSPSGAGAGSGLGLSIASEVALSHGGGLRLAKTETGFHVTLTFSKDGRSA